MGKSDIMLDLETLSLEDNPVIIQLSAIQFDLKTGQTYSEFSETINPKSCIESGLALDSSTISWWLTQEMTAINDVFINSITSGKELSSVLDDFSNFVKNVREGNERISVWGNGILADNLWLKSAYSNSKKKIPWKYFENKDVRTLADLGSRILNKDIKNETKFEGVQHNAIDDCKHQIKYCHEIYKQLEKMKIPCY
tara:strand:- start:4846 stop:5436 length:591 start_codon:yes stop_codon:yes gene_type:complete